MNNGSQIKILAFLIVSVFALGAVSIFTDEAYADEATNKDLLINELQSVFDDTTELTNVATATIDADGIISVTFKTVETSQVKAGALALVDALKVIDNLDSANSTLKVGTETFTLNNMAPGDVTRLANAVLGDGGLAGFLNTGSLKTDYEANVMYNGVNVKLTSNVTFTATKETIKETLINELQSVFDDTTELTNVATATIDADGIISVTFKTVETSQVKAGALALVDALKVIDNLDSANSTLKVGTETFTLNNMAPGDVTRLANAVLGDGGLAGFLNTGSLKTDYEANVMYNGVNVKLTSNVTFTATKETIKETLINELQSVFDDTTELTNVATATIDADGIISVTFKTVETSQVKAGALALVDALKVIDNLDSANSTLKVGTETFTLNNMAPGDVTRLANAVLGDGGLAGFLNTGSLKTDYEANVMYNGVNVKLTSNVTFTATKETIKETLINELQSVFDDTTELTNVATATIDADGIISVTFKTVETSQVKAGALALVDALKVIDNLDSANSTLKVGTETFTLNNMAPGDVTRLANAVLGDGGLAGFLNTGSLKTDYEANVMYNGVNVKLTSNVSFAVVDALMFTVNFDDTEIEVMGVTTQINNGDSVAEGATLTVTAEKKGHTSSLSANGVLITSEEYTVTGDVTFSVVYTPINYTVTWIVDGIIDDKTTQVAYGVLPVYGDDPVKAATAQYTFNFTGWTPEIVNVIGDVEYTATFSEDLRIYDTIPSTDVLDDLISQNNDPVLQLTVDALGTIDNSAFKDLGDKSFVINVMKEDGVTPAYSWTFSGKYKADEGTTFNAGISEPTPSEDLNAAIDSAKVESSLVLKFEASGELPADASVKYNVGDKYAKGTKLSLFFYNEDTKKLDDQSQEVTVDADGYVTFNLTHCSFYVLAEISPDVVIDDVATANNTMLYIGIAIIVIIIGMIAIVAVRSKGSA